MSSSVDALAAAVLDRRLLTDSPRPIALALSGGGDSVALLLAVQAWAEAHGRSLLALTVDHRLQPQSAAWTAACAGLAARRGVAFRALAWDGPKPARGLPAAARAARHRLLADAARDAGARVILLGHTADDVLEARAMRAEGSTAPDPREWSPSPAWPEGRGLFLGRPLLGVRRAALRDWLAERGEGWIDDPANADLRFARARARADLDAAAAIAPPQPAPLALARACKVDAAGAVTLARRDFRAAAAPDASRWLSIACVCAGGGARPPSGAAREALAQRLRSHDAIVASLAGARAEADADEIRIVREAGEAGRGGLGALALAGEPVVWDGRFEIFGRDLEVRRLGGLSRRLPVDQQRRLLAIPAAVRPALPAVVDACGTVSSPLLGGMEASAACLVEGRLAAAADLIEREPA